MNATDRIASFIAETGYEGIPPETVAAAKRAMLDCLGVTVAGCGEPAPKILIEQAIRWAAREEASAIGTSLRTTAELAAWINGTASHALDYDDTSAGVAGYNMHPSMPVFPAVFAVGESRGSSGKELLAAYVVGIEVESRVGAAIGRYASANGWHSSRKIVGKSGWRAIWGPHWA